MIRTHWVKKAVSLGVAATLSLTTCVTLEDATNSAASTLCQETEMAGLSLSLDKYYTSVHENADYITDETTDVASSGITDVATSGGITAEDTGELPSEEEKAKDSEKKSSDKKKEKKEEKVSERFQTMGISVASDYVNIRKHPSTDSKILGKLYEGSSATIKATKGNWVKIESGQVTGYINKDYLAIGAEAQKLKDKYGRKFASVKPGVITLNVRAKMSRKATILTQIPEDEEYDVVREDNDWVKISIDDGTEGYVASEYVKVVAKFKHAISIKEEKAKIARRKAAERAEQERLRQLAAERRAQAAQASQSSSNTGSSTSQSSTSHSSSSQSSTSHSSVSQSSSSRSSSAGSSSHSSSAGSSSSSSSSGSTVSSSVGSGTGSEIASYARKFVGNPYVYGGSSLTNGTDCSGFTMSIYAQFGYSLPHSSRAQSGYGTSVSLANVKPGDLIFYKNGSTIGHVALYIGGGQVVHASNARDGIKISNMYYRQPCAARRIV